VIGSEGGSSYSAAVIHLAEGMFGPVFGWGDPDLKDRNSEFYLGQYYPPDGPKVFVKQVPMKEKYQYFNYDPRYRLPLYEIVRLSRLTNGRTAVSNTAICSIPWR